MSTPLEQAITDIRAERARQDAKWGPDRDQPHTLWHTILSEEVGEVAQAILEVTFPRGPEPTAEQLQHLYEELIQTAAVATAHAEAVLRHAAQARQEPTFNQDNAPRSA